MLLVDDNAMHRVLTAGLLEERGYSVIPAADGVEAVELYGSADYDFVVMDLRMPRMDGFDAAREIRRVEQGRVRRVPIIAVTSLEAEADQERALVSGMDAHLTKPIDPAALDAILDAHGAEDKADFEPSLALLRASGDAGLLATVVRMFLRETPERLEAIHRAVDRGDVDALGETAHTIEDRADELVMPRLREVAHRMAVLSDQGDFERAAALAADLERAVDRGASAVGRMVADA